MGWTRGSVEATIRLVTQQQRLFLADLVRGEMERQNLTNALLAQRAKVAEKTVSRIINAKLAPRYGTVERISTGLGLEPSALWTALGEAIPATRSHETPDLVAALGASQLDRIEAQLALMNPAPTEPDALAERIIAAVGDLEEAARLSRQVTRIIDRRRHEGA